MTDYKWHKYDNMPTSYALFEEKMEQGIRLNKTIMKRLSRFPFRYRLAKSFVGIDAKEVGKTLIGYEAGMKVFLAYTAYEELIQLAKDLGVAEIKSKNDNEIIDKQLATKFIKNTRLIQLIRDDVKAKDAQINEQIELFIRGDTHDVLFLARAIRNLYAHGVFTATGGGVNTKAKRGIYYMLADRLLRFCNKRYTNCVKLIGV